MNLTFTPNGWSDYLWWAEHDRKILARLNKLIAEVLRHPTEGIGKPEQLRYGTPNTWSRRITEEHRLVYRIHQDGIEILAARYHHD